MNSQELFESLKTSNGDLDEIKVRDLTEKYVELQNNTSQVYETVTKGLLKDPNYNPDIVIHMYNLLQKELVSKKTVCEDMVHLVGHQNTELKNLVLEYFGKLPK